MGATKPLTMDDFEAAFLRDAKRLYGFGPEKLNTSEKRYMVKQCLLANPKSEYRELVKRMIQK